MKKLLASICFLALSTKAMTASVNTDIGVFDVQGHITIFGYQTTGNEFNDTSSTDDTWKRSRAGVLVHYSAGSYVDAKLYSTTEHLLDFGFIDIHIPLNKYNSGIRLGRVNRLSGMFGGFGPHADKMNFLPQATNTDRIGRTFYRFDGAQLYTSVVFDNNHKVGFEFTYGNPVIPDQGGIFDPSFFAVFDPHNSKIDVNDPVMILNLNYTYRDWELFADYYVMDITFDTVFHADLDAEHTSRLTGIPIEMFPEDFVYHYEQPMVVETYPAYGLSAGISKAIGDTEIIYMYSKQVGKMSDPDVAADGEGLAGRLVPRQHSIIVRQHFDANMAYTGLSYFKSFYDADDLAKLGIRAPSHIGYGKGAFVGLYRQLAPNMSAIVEYRHNKGASFLSSTYQDPLTARRSWNIYSISLNITF